jgi:hypothetical protein
MSAGCMKIETCLFILEILTLLLGNGGVNCQEDCRWILLASADEHDTTLEGTNDNVQVGICCHS